MHDVKAIHIYSSYLALKKDCGYLNEAVLSCTHNLHF